MLQQVRELERLDVVLDALDEVGLAVEQAVPGEGEGEG